MSLLMINCSMYIYLNLRLSVRYAFIIVIWDSFCKRIVFRFRNQRRKKFALVQYLDVYSPKCLHMPRQRYRGGAHKEVIWKCYWSLVISQLHHGCIVFGSLRNIILKPDDAYMSVNIFRSRYVKYIDPIYSSFTIMHSSFSYIFCGNYFNWSTETAIET